MKFKVKICGITSPDDAIAISKMNIDFIGFIFCKDSRRYVGSEPDEILFKIPKKTNKTGVFVDEVPSFVKETTKRYDLAFVQLHGSESPDYCRLLRENGIRSIKAFSLNEKTDFDAISRYEGACDYILFDSGVGRNGGSGIKSDWKILDDYQLSMPFFLSGGIGPEDVEVLRCLRHRSLYGIDINSRFEISPGIKDIPAVRNFLKNLMTET